MLSKRSVRNIVLAAALLAAGVCHAQQPKPSPASRVAGQRAVRLAAQG